jgi:hypothetical protein
VATTTPDLQQDTELETQTEIDSTVSAGNQDEQTLIALEADEYDEIVLAGDEQASQYTKEEVLVHKLSNMRKQKRVIKTESSEKDTEIESLKTQMREMRQEFGYEDAPQAAPAPTATAQPAPQIDESIFNNHYSAAANLKVKDYQETEQALRESLGGNIVDALIVEARDKSPIVLYHLQKNPAKLEQFKHAMATNVSDAQRMIWQLSNDLKVNSVKRDPVPVPESEVRGQASGVSQDDQLDKLRDEYVNEVNSGGDGKDLFKKMKVLKSQIRSQ